MNEREEDLKQRESLSAFVRRGIAAIEKTKRSGGGIPADLVVAKLEAKLAAARDHRSPLLPT